MNNQRIQSLRKDYSKHKLDKQDVDPNPVKQFDMWLEQALAAEVPQPNATTLATVDKENMPQARIILLKSFDDDGFVFFTNYASDKGREIEANPKVSMCFFWVELERQIRINGSAEKISKEESETYFKSRPYESQIGALASNQSEVIESRQTLEEKFDALFKKYPQGEVPMPETWGGYILKPETFEFWQGRPSRLHDRIKYIKEGNDWAIKRLSP